MSIVCVVLAIVTLTPLVIAVNSGFRENAPLLNRPIALPDPLITSNYTDVLTSPAFWRQTFNSVVVMLLTTVLVLSLASSAAFVIARMQFRGREPLFTFRG